MREIILASQSPRRKQLLQQLVGTNFIVKESQYEEDNTLTLKPSELVKYPASGKAKDVAASINRGIVIGTDTVIVFNDEILGKPHTEEVAKSMLKKLSGNTVDVISGLVLIDTEQNKILQDHTTTKVKFKDLTQKEIESYVKSGEPLDKAGAFGIQGKGAALIEWIHGCYFNVVGLPLFKLNEMLEKLDVDIFKLHS